jgi:hypothetical protein
MIGRKTMAADAQATAIIIPPTGCGSFAIFAVGDPNHPINNLSITGGGQGITINQGGLYSGGNTHVQNTTIVNGDIDSGGSCGTANQCSGSGATTVLNGAPVQTVPQWDINDFLPHGAVEGAVGSTYYHYIDGDMTSFASPVADGVYYVTGDVKITGGTGTHRVTIVSQGTQKYTSAVNLSSYFHDLLFFSNSNDQNNGAIQLSGSNITWQGLIYAPNGDVNMSAATNSNVNGAIYGQHVGLSGSNININYDPAACPPTRARVILFK